MNAPSLTEYELRRGKFGDILYVKEKGIEYPERNEWGFCNGTDLFINSTDKYSKLIKQQHSFYFAGIKGITKKNALPRLFMYWQLLHYSSTQILVINIFLTKKY